MCADELSVSEVANKLSMLPVFFIGDLPRSGTTWIQQLLDRHPNLVCLGESHYINDLVPSIAKVANQYIQKRSQNYRTWAPSVEGPNGDLILPVLRSAFTSIIQANIGDKNIITCVRLERKPKIIFYT